MKYIYKKIALGLAILISSTSLYAIDEPSDYTPIISIRSLLTGVPITRDDGGKAALGSNWTISEIRLPSKLGKFPFGVVQFVSAIQPGDCLSIDIRDKFGITRCESTAVGLYGVAFSILPTISSAVQIQSITKRGFCLSVVNPYAKQTIDQIGLKPCVVDENQDIPLENLFNISPAFNQARITR
ncbi:toxin [Campylobacter fetus]|uniref:toxin n=1 Tax=Campylobacter fetus TaxID=196 RepID=UPI000CFCEF63|nr:toxin [Campylobacter fetus]AVK81210.1 toxin [Campylobacter fetus subsp. testudinum]